MRDALHIEGVVLIAGFIALVLFHLYLSRHMAGPVAYEDGMGYLGAARYFAGYDVVPTLGPMSFYHPAYSFVLAPLYVLFDEPATVYRGVMVVNGVLASAQVFPLYLLARKLMGVPGPQAAVAALMTGLYPAFMLQANFEYADNLYPVVFALFALAALRFMGRRDVTSGALMGLLTGGLYFVHPRAIIVVPAIVGLLLLLAVLRRLPAVPVLVAGGIALAIFVGTRLFNAHLLDTLYAVGSGTVDPGDSELAIVTRFLDPDVWGIFVVRVCGQLWYLTVATVGLLPVGLVVLAVLAVRGARRLHAGLDDPEGLAATATLLACTSIFLVSTIAVTVGPQSRVDHFVYGRYNEGWLNVVLLAGLGRALLLGRARWPRWAALAIVSTAVLGIVTWYGNDPESFQGALAPLNVLGALLHIRETDRLAVLQVTITGLAAALAFWGLLAWRRTVAIAALAVFFCIGAVDGEARVLRPFTAYWMDLVSMHRGVAVIDEEIADIDRIAYDTSHFSVHAANGYQFWLDTMEFVRFDSTVEEPPAELVMSSKTWGEGGDAALVMLETNINQALWVRPGPLQEELEREGFTIEALDAPLPPDALRSRITTSSDRLELLAGESAEIEVEVTHTGSESPWLPLAVIAPPHTGAVRVVAAWRAADSADTIALQLADLNETVVPGGTADIRLTLAASDLEGTPLPAGRYVVEVQLIQEGLQWFADHGDDVAEITVDVE